MQHLNLDQIILHCRQEATQTYHQEVGYCFELFRRAIEQQDAVAWEALQQQYQKLVLRWAHVAAHDSLTSERFDDLGQDTWFRFWRTLTQHQDPFSKRFPHVGAVLNYLHQCCISAFLDYERKQHRQIRLQETLALSKSETVSDWGAYWDNKEQEEQIRLIQIWVNNEVQDPTEKLLLSLSYEQNLTPAAIVQRYPAQFPTVAEVYRIKERVIKRARRALSAKLPS